MLATIADWALCLAGAVMILVTAASFLRIPHGAIRSLDFPRLQAFALCLVLAALIWWTEPAPWNLAWAGALVVAALAQAALILPFTPLWRRQSHRPSAPATERQMTILACNVKQSNRDYHRLIAAVRREDPDIVIGLETDEGWAEALAVLHDSYPHRVMLPQDNGYGITLQSRLEIYEHEVRELLLEGVPSIRARIALQNDEHFRLYIVHPEPPVPYHDSEGRDAEIGMVGIEAEKDPLPAVVAGDLNDVAWSHTTRRFQRLSGLLDPRVGRGFFNTFDARYPFLRWPLDHMFHDPRFRLVDMRRLEHVGSDHFPMLFSLQLEPVEKGDLPEDATSEDKQEIREMAQTERARDREPIGSDWEDED
ncbi:endonuclease/exonuclease/phosphatase family protein [Frigidibacter sp. MR17.14]|uniref:endonuclease/exonuclease/phosphatase family protein n=1 Tax=Frigidibacter sp. MR17.14 TaxID=3126509 RepID=UPI003012B8E6